MHREPPIEKAELELAVMDGNGVAIVRIIGLAHKLERCARRQSGDNVLAPFKRDAREFRVKVRRVADRGVRIVQILVALGEEALYEGVGFRLSSFLSSFGYAQDYIAELGPSTSLRVTGGGVEGAEERFEGGLRRCGRRKTLRARRPREALRPLRS
jgi:hypothetical protein